MNLHYKEAPLKKIRLHYLSDDNSEQFFGKNIEFRNDFANDQNPENPDFFIDFIHSQSQILCSENELDVFKAVNDLSAGLSLYPSYAKFFDLNRGTLISILAALEYGEKDTVLSAIKLLKTLVFFAPITRDYVDENVVTLINSKLKMPICFHMAAELIEILAQLADANDMLLMQLFRNGVVSSICDILSCINPFSAPSRVEPPIEELPFQTDGIDLEDHVLIYPLLVFSYNVLKKEESYSYFVSEQLLQHIIGTIHLQLNENEMSYALGALASISALMNKFDKGDLFLQCIKQMGITKLFDFASNNSPFQINVLNILLNISYYDVEENNHFLESNHIFQILYNIMKNNEISENCIHICLKILINLAYSMNKGRKFMKQIDIFEAFQLEFLNNIFDSISFQLKVDVAELFINLLEEHSFQDQITSKIDISNIFLPFFQSQDPSLLSDISLILKQFIEDSQDDNFKIQLCSSIENEGVLDLFSDPGSSDCSSYINITLLNNTVEETMKAYEQYC